MQYNFMTKVTFEGRFSCKCLHFCSQILPNMLNYLHGGGSFQVNRRLFLLDTIILKLELLFFISHLVLLHQYSKW